MTHDATPDFSKGLVPVIVQRRGTREVLMLGYMNEEAYDKTRASGQVTFFSRSKNRLWTKGETSGNFLQVQSMCLDCDRDTLLIEADATGPVCHTGSATCFNQTIGEGISFLSELRAVISARHAERSNSSYTSSLFSSGIDRMAQKVGEEGVEVVIAAKNPDDETLLNEAADLVFHLMVLLEARGMSLDSVANVLRQRHQKR